MANLAVWAHLLPRGPQADFEGSKIKYILRLTLDPKNAFESTKSLGAYRFGPLFLQHFAFEICKKHYIYGILYFLPGNLKIAFWPKWPSNQYPSWGVQMGAQNLI